MCPKKTIGLFTLEHYAVIADLMAIAFPESARSREELRPSDELLAVRLKKQRWVAEIKGHVVGCAACSWFSRHDKNHPSRISRECVVPAPDFCFLIFPGWGSC